MMTEAAAPPPAAADKDLVDIANYVCDYRIDDARAWAAARRCLVDTLAGAFDAVRHPACARLLGPLVPGTALDSGARVPGTHYEMDPATAAFNIGCLIRWHDLNDTFTGAAASHPSDNLAGILAVADYLGRRPSPKTLRMKDVLESLIKAYEIQGCIGMSNSCFGRLHISDYEDESAADPLIDALRDKMIVTEDPRFTAGFFDPARRSSATGLQVRFKDGSSTPRMDVEYPVGHPTRREESAAVFEKKFTAAVERFFPPAQCARIISMCADQARFEETTVDVFMTAFAVN